MENGVYHRNHNVGRFKDSNIFKIITRKMQKIEIKFETNQFFRDFNDIRHTNLKRSLMRFNSKVRNY